MLDATDRRLRPPAAKVVGFYPSESQFVKPKWAETPDFQAWDAFFAARGPQKLPLTKAPQENVRNLASKRDARRSDERIDANAAAAFATSTRHAALARIGLADARLDPGLRPSGQFLGLRSFVRFQQFVRFQGFAVAQ